MADDLDLADIFNLDEEKLSIISASLQRSSILMQNDESAADVLNYGEPDHSISKDDEMPTSVAPQEIDKRPDSNFVEVDDVIIKDDDEFQSLLTSFAPREVDTSAISDMMDKLDLFIKDYDFEPLQTFLASIGNDDSNFLEPDHVSDPDLEFESLLPLLAPIEKDDKCVSDDFNFDGIMEHIFNCSTLHKRTKDDTLRDISEIVVIGLTRGDIRKDQLEMTAPGGAQRIVELAYWYKIPLRSAPGERVRLKSDTLTFVRAITCFPHTASLELVKTVGSAKNGAESSLASEQLPDAMKHAGFCGLIPTCSDPYLMKAYLFAHTAYMVDFGKLINPGDKRSLKAMALSQLEYFKVGVEKLPYDDEFRVGILRAVGLTDPGVFKIVDVCNNLCKVVGEPEIDFATAEKCHIKNSMISFFEDDSKDVAAGEQTKDLADILRVTGIQNPFSHKD